MSDQSMPVALLGWKSIAKGALLGFADVRLGRTLTIHDVPVLASGGRVWASLPGKPLVGADGMVLRDGKGKTRYAPVLEWDDKASRERWSVAVVEAVEREHGKLAVAAGGAA